MATLFSTTSKKFFSQYTNGPTFVDNPSLFTTNMVGNNGEILKYIEEIEVRTIYNESQSINTNLNELFANATQSNFIASGINFITQGFVVGSDIQIEWQDTQNAATTRILPNVTILNITGVDNKELFISATDFLAMVALDSGLQNSNGFVILDSFVFKQETAPTYLNYRYGINQNSFTGTSYQSLFDTVSQSYYTNNVLSGNPLIFTGGVLSNDLGTVDITFDGTDDVYRHTFTLEHVFKVPYFIDGEALNLRNSINPPRLASIESLRYDNSYAFGTPTQNNTLFEQVGLAGNYGYESENFNGQLNNYSIGNVSVVNSLNTNVLEVTVANTVTFEITSTGGSWTTGVDTAILGHSKLVSSAIYQGNTTPFDQLWLYENLEATIDGGTVANSIITGFSVVIDGGDPTLMLGEVIITYDVAQQLTIPDDSQYYLWITVAHNDLGTPSIIDKVTLPVNVATYSRDSDVDGLIDTEGYELRFYAGWDAVLQGNKYSGLTAGDGDLQYCVAAFPMVVLNEPRIETAEFKIIATNGGTEFILYSQTFNLGVPQDVAPAAGLGATYQLMNVSNTLSFNLPSTEAINQFNGVMVEPAVLPSTTQDVLFSFGFQTSWREWILNLAVDTIFFDSAETNNNQNFKTSNYSGLQGYNVFGVLDMNIGNNLQTDPTVYRLTSTSSPILDFDSASWLIGTSAVTTYFASNGDITASILSTEDTRIEINLTHTGGTLAVGTIAGEIWIEEEVATGNPWFLSTERDWTNPNNILMATDTLSTGNNSLVEIVSTNNSIILICQTNNLNVPNNTTYNVYGRFWNK